jgi:aromatic ring-opening dioxygenase catalytic subunit (LigB family)
MAEIVFAAGAPHAPGLIGLLNTAPPDVKDIVATTYRNLADAITEARPDVLIVFANDHLANSRVRAYPDFLIGMSAEHRGPFEWFKPWIGCEDYTVKGSPEIAAALFDGMSRRGIRMFAQNENLKFDDNISVPVLLTNIAGSGIPMVPVLQNCTVPPIPDQHRCYQVGKALGDFIRNDLPADMRVALLGSGGLSHEPGGARYYFIDEVFDRWFLSLVASGDHEKLLRELTIEKMEAAGSGGTAELLAWVVVLGAIGPKPGKSFGYAVHKEFKCGIGAVLWDIDANMPKQHRAVA